EAREAEVGTAANEELAHAVARAEKAEEHAQELEAELAERQQQAEQAAAEEEPVVPGAPGEYNLRQLEQLLRDAQLRSEPQAEEWAYYVPLLSEHADFEGRLPPEFNALVANVFGI